MTELETGVELELPEEKPKEVMVIPPHVTDVDDEENIDHE